MPQTKKPAKAESTVIKPMAKKDRFKNLGGEIGNPPFPNGRKGTPYVAPTMGGAKNGKTMKKAKSGAKMKKAENGSAFAKLAPPYNKATFADKIAGATKNKAKAGAKMAKCKTGCY